MEPDIENEGGGGSNCPQTQQIQQHSTLLTSKQEIANILAKTFENN